MPVKDADSLTAQDWQAWRDYLAATFNVSLSEEALSRFKIYFEELTLWNATMNLVSFRSQKEVLWRHFADSLAGIKNIDDHERAGTAVSRIIDIGTGAGFPGIPVKIARPGLHLTLIESVTKKCSFLEHLRQRLGLSDVEIINDRAENAGQKKEYRARFEVVLSRAVSKLSPNLEIALPLLKKGGIALLYKTERLARDTDEQAAGTRALPALGGRAAGMFCYRMPGQEQSYCIVQYEKVKDTPAAYPRRPGVPEKKPL